MGEIVDVQAVQMPRTADTDIQIATAKKYPRVIKEVRKEALELATDTKEIAATMSYAVPRGGKNITGPSVRLAEVFASAWGNIRSESRILDADDTHVRAESVCWDLEKNVAFRVEVKRSIIGNYGRFKPDMITVTGNAAASIAFREAVFKVVPRAYVEAVRQAALKKSLGKASNLVDSRTKAFEEFHRFGVTDAQILYTLKRDAMEDVTAEDIGVLRGYFTAITVEGVDVTEIFKPIESDADKQAKEDLKARMKKGKTSKQAADDFDDENPFA